MSDSDDRATGGMRLRREPPPLLPVEVVERQVLSPRMVRLTFEGAGLATMESPEPAASVRLLVPSPGTRELVIPTWNGNEFLLPDGERPALRTFTPLRHEPDARRLDLWIVRHPGGAVSQWAETADVGSPAAISGPGRGYEIDPAADRFILLGDETALPAIAQLLEDLPADVDISVDVELEDAAAELSLPAHDGVDVRWHVRDPAEAPGHRLIDAARGLGPIDSGVLVWAAGEAAAMQAIRKHLFDSVGMSRRQATVRGYWKVPRDGR